MKEIKHIEDDVVGEETLNVIADADNFNRWMYESIKPFCKGKILEIGSGIGNISNYLMQDSFDLMLSDLRKGYCDKLDEKFKDNPHFLGTEIMNLTDEDFDEKFKNHIGVYDTVFSLNVVEHIKEDSLAIKNSKKLLKNNGTLIILVPSYQTLHNTFDVQLGHFKRYNTKSLSKLFFENKLEIIHKQYFNFIGVFGWFVTGSLMKKETIPGGQMKLYNLLVPIFKIIDKIIFNSIGLSTIVVGTKKEN